jgi:hypothetical protein
VAGAGDRVPGAGAGEVPRALQQTLEELATTGGADVHPSSGPDYRISGRKLEKYLVGASKTVLDVLMLAYGETEGIRLFKLGEDHPDRRRAVALAALGGTSEGTPFYETDVVEKK